MREFSGKFGSINGEGTHAGELAVFLRFRGCNLNCGFCDTKWANAADAPATEESAEELVEYVRQTGVQNVTLTGGEPLLQLTGSLVKKLHDEGRFVQIETNGTLPAPEEWHIDWITCSPKTDRIMLERIDELKVLYVNSSQDMSRYAALTPRVRCLQPCDTGYADRNRQLLREATDYCLSHPEWRLSLQTHKIINIK